MTEVSCNLTRRVVPISFHDMITFIGSVNVELIGPWVQQIQAFIGTTLQTKWPVTEAEYSQEFQESLTRDYLGLVHSVLRAHSPVYILLISVVYWCSQRRHRSWTQYSKESLTHYRTHYAVPQLQSLLTLPSPHALRYALTQHSDSPWHDSPSLATHWAYIIFICTSRTDFAVLVSAGYMLDIPKIVCVLVRKDSGIPAALTW